MGLQCSASSRHWQAPSSPAVKWITHICYWAWRGVYQDQTSRYGTAYGWRTSYLHEEGHGANDWRTRPGICVDQAWEPDACGWKSYINP